MAVDVVDRLEAIEVDDHGRHGPPLLGGGQKKVFDGVAQSAAVEETGQRIGGGKRLRAPFGGGALDDLAPDVAVTADPVDGEGDVEQQQPDDEAAIVGAQPEQMLLQRLYIIVAERGQEQESAHRDAEYNEIGVV